MQWKDPWKAKLDTAAETTSKQRDKIMKLTKRQKELENAIEDNVQSADFQSTTADATSAHDAQVSAEAKAGEAAEAVATGKLRILELESDLANIRESTHSQQFRLNPALNECKRLENVVRDRNAEIERVRSKLVSAAKETLEATNAHDEAGRSYQRDIQQVRVDMGKETDEVRKALDLPTGAQRIGEQVVDVTERSRTAVYEP